MAKLSQAVLDNVMTAFVMAQPNCRKFSLKNNKKEETDLAIGGLPRVLITHPCDADARHGGDASVVATFEDRMNFKEDFL